MYKYICLASILCLLTSCMSSTSRPLPPPPPPMPFNVAWAPDAAPMLLVPNDETLLAMLDSCNSGGFTGKNTKDEIFPSLTFFSKALNAEKSLHAGKLYALHDYTNGTQNTVAVMVNLVAAKNGEILECVAEKVVYRSK